MRRSASVIEQGPVGDTLYNGLALGGNNIYPWSTGLAINPPAYYQQYQGSGMGTPIVPPVAALEASTGNPIGGATSAGVGAAMSNPLSKWSPLPWVIAGLVLAVLVTYHMHYK